MVTKPSPFPLFGMTIHHHARNLTFKSESDNDLVSKLRMLCENEGTLLTEELRFEMKRFLDMHQNDFLPALREVWREAPTKLEDGYSPFIIPGILEFRSILLWLNSKLLQLSKKPMEVRLDMEAIITIIICCISDMMEERLSEKRKHSDQLLPMNLYSFTHDPEERLKDKTPYHFFRNLNGEYRTSFLMFYKSMLPLTASFSKCGSDLSSIFRKLKFGLFQCYFVANPKKSTMQTIEFLRRVTVKEGKALWNLQDDPLFRIFLFMALPDIDCSKMFSIPSFTYEDLISKPIKSCYLKRPKSPSKEILLIESEAEGNLKEGGVEIEVLELQDVRNPATYTAPVKKTFSPISQSGGISIEEFHFIRSQLHVPLKNYNRDKIDIRLLYHGKNSHLMSFNFNKTRKDYPFLATVKRALRIFQRSRPVDHSSGNVIVMIHGGGMVAMSTFSHENYMRELAKKTGIPIFMIEYTTAPEEMFPAQIEQCYHAYKWIVENALQYLGVPLNKIFLTGDSAGGNFSCALTYRCIEEEYRKPDGVILTYPACNVSVSASQSRILAFVDPLVNINFLKVCSNSYPPKDSNIPQNVFLSPAFAPDIILKHFPPCYICVGSLDPLYDDGIMFAERLTKLNGYQNVCLHVYDGLAHGFMNAIDFVSESQAIIDDYASWILAKVDDEYTDLKHSDESTLISTPQEKHSPDMMSLLESKEKRNEPSIELKFESNADRTLPVESSSLDEIEIDIYPTVAA